MHPTENNGDYRVKLEIFEGPLDLLLFLIQREKVDIFDIPIHLITEQYMAYLNLMKMLSFDIAGEFLVMAATLMKIKSRMLLPSSTVGEEEVEDPRDELVRQLIEYRKFKRAALRLRTFETQEEDYHYRDPESCRGEEGRVSGNGDQDFIQVNIFELLSSYFELLKREWASPAIIEGERISIKDKMDDILRRLENDGWIDFGELFVPDRDRVDLIVTFLALLELIRLLRVQVRQPLPLGMIKIRLRPQR